jgi:hypothetical protein
MTVDWQFITAILSSNPSACFPFQISNFEFQIVKHSLLGLSVYPYFQQIDLLWDFNLSGIRLSKVKSPPRKGKIPLLCAGRQTQF